jgi:hypothetical protein
MSPASGPPLGLSRRLLPSTRALRLPLPYPPSNVVTYRNASMSCSHCGDPRSTTTTTRSSVVVRLRAAEHCRDLDADLHDALYFHRIVSSFRCLPEEAIQTRVAGPIIEPDKPGSDDSDRPVLTPINDGLPRSYWLPRSRAVTCRVRSRSSTLYGRLS